MNIFANLNLRVNVILLVYVSEEIEINKWQKHHQLFLVIAVTKSMDNPEINAAMMLPLYGLRCAETTVSLRTVQF